MIKPVVNIENDKNGQPCGYSTIIPFGAFVDYRLFTRKICLTTWKVEVLSCAETTHFLFWKHLFLIILKKEISVK